MSWSRHWTERLKTEMLDLPAPNAVAEAGWAGIQPHFEQAQPGAVTW
jgi:hypothetical protein